MPPVAAYVPDTLRIWAASNSSDEVNEESVENQDDRLLRSPGCGPWQALKLVLGLVVIAVGFYVLVSDITLRGGVFAPVLIMALGLDPALDGAAELLPANWNKRAGALRAGAHVTRLVRWGALAALILTWVS